MKIVFIENKYKTLFWQKVSSKLVKAGHEIHWIVQNKWFKPSFDNVHYIKLPRKLDLLYDQTYVNIENKDRYSYIYKNRVLHYKYYSEAIEKALLSIKPKLVFGESTLFHELLTIDLCKQHNILYLHPSTSRYPPGRMSFYKYDSLEVFAGSGEVWPHRKVKSLLDDINRRAISLDYMKKPKKLNKIGFYLRRFTGLLVSFLSVNIIGEIYNTPTLKDKRSIESNCRKNKVIYESLCSHKLENFSNKNTIIFPLQMQPESNIDVWGAPHNSQPELIHQLVKNLGPNWNILIKPNPKPKYEMNDELITSIKNLPNVFALSHFSNMKEIFQKFDVFFSVTGTINYECIFANKSCYSPSLPITREFEPSNYKIPTLSDLNKVDDSRRDNSMRLLNKLIRGSYDGLIGDPIHSPPAMDGGNIEIVSHAFLDVTDRVEGVK
jgi:hypothetical protein